MNEQELKISKLFIHCPFCGHPHMKFSLRLSDWNYLYVQGHVYCDRCFIGPHYVESVPVGHWVANYNERGEMQGQKIERYLTEEEAINRLVSDMTSRWNKRYETTTNQVPGHLGDAGV